MTPLENEYNSKLAQKTDEAAQTLVDEISYKLWGRAADDTTDPPTKEIKGTET